MTLCTPIRFLSWSPGVLSTLRRESTGLTLILSIAGGRIAPERPEASQVTLLDTWEVEA